MDSGRPRYLCEPTGDKMNWHDWSPNGDMRYMLMLAVALVVAILMTRMCAHKGVAK